MELQSQGTWMGGGLKREVGVFLVKESEIERWKESGIEESLSASFLLKADPTGS